MSQKKYSKYWDDVLHLPSLKNFEKEKSIFFAQPPPIPRPLDLVC